MTKKQIIKNKEENTELVKKQDTISVGYSGKVKVTVVDDRKVVSRKVGHNAGGQPLFLFLAQCLCGNYENAKTSQPLKIKLFYNKAETVADATDNIEAWASSSSSGSSSSEKVTSASNFIFVNGPGTPEEIEITDKNTNNKTKNGYKAILHFRVPFVFVTQNKVNQICLYAQNENDDKKYSAYYLFKASEDEKKLAPIKVNNQQASYNLIIEWELSIANVKVTNTQTASGSGGNE